MNSDKKGNRNLIFIILAIVVVLALWVIIFIFPGKTQNYKIDHNPVILDDYTRIDSTTFISDQKINYYLTLNLPIDSIDLYYLSKHLDNNIITSIRKDKDYHKWLKKGLIFSYNYYDKNGKFFLSRTISPEMYKK